MNKSLVQPNILFTKSHTRDTSITASLSLTDWWFHKAQILRDTISASHSLGSHFETLLPPFESTTNHCSYSKPILDLSFHCVRFFQEFFSSSRSSRAFATSRRAWKLVFFERSKATALRSSAASIRCFKIVPPCSTTLRSFASDFSSCSQFVHFFDKGVTKSSMHSSLSYRLTVSPHMDGSRNGWTKLSTSLVQILWLLGWFMCCKRWESGQLISGWYYRSDWCSTTCYVYCNVAPTEISVNIVVFCTKVILSNRFIAFSNSNIFPICFCNVKILRLRFGSQPFCPEASWWWHFWHQSWQFGQRLFRQHSNLMEFWGLQHCFHLWWKRAASSVSS